MEQLKRLFVYIVFPAVMWAGVVCLIFACVGCTDAMLGRWTGIKAGVFILPVQSIDERQTLQDSDKEFSTKAPAPKP